MTIVSTVNIGDKISFKPSCWYATRGEQGPQSQEWLPMGDTVTGTVDYINEAHNWYRVAYEISGTVQHECFPIQMPETPLEYERENPHNKRLQTPRTAGDVEKRKRRKKK